MQFWGRGGWKAIISWLCCTWNCLWLSCFVCTDVHILPWGEEVLCLLYNMTKPLSREELYYFRKPVNVIKPHLFSWANPTAISARQLQGILECKRDTSGWNLHLVTNVSSVAFLLWGHHLNRDFFFVCLFFVVTFPCLWKSFVPVHFQCRLKHPVVQVTARCSFQSQRIWVEDKEEWVTG